MMKRQKLLDNYRGTKNLKVMSCVVESKTTMENFETGRRLKKQMKKRKFSSFSIELILVILLLMISCMPHAFTLNIINNNNNNNNDQDDVILSPNPQKILSGKYSFFNPEYAASSSSKQIYETSTRVPWEEPLKETVNMALGKSLKISKNAIMKATYTGFNDLNAPNFGDISILAKGKLKLNANKTFSFEQMNEKCDDKCQANADKFLENVTALWMVERIRHREKSEHRFDLKFTIIPIHNDNEQHIDHNTLESRLKNHMKKTYILRDLDYPKYFNRRTDLFNSAGFSRSLSNLMSPANNMLHTILGINLAPISQQLQQQSPSSSLINDHQHNQQQQHHVKEIIRDTRLNTGEYYMGIKTNLPNQKLNYHPPANVIAHGNLKVKFPEPSSSSSQEHQHQIVFKTQQPNIKTHQQLQRGHRPKPEIYHRNMIDPRGTGTGGDNVHVSSDHQNFHYYHHHHVTKTPTLQSVPLYSIPIDMNIIQLPAAAAAIPLSLQFSTPTTNPASNVWIPQPEVTTFRYPHLVGVAHQFLPISTVGKSHHHQQIKESGEQHTSVITPHHHYSRPDPIYHSSSPSSSSSAHKTEALTSDLTTKRKNNYANSKNVGKQNTASSIQVNNKYEEEDNEFKPITPTYDIRKYNNKNSFRLSTTTSSPTSATKQPILSSHYLNNKISGSTTTTTTKKPNSISSQYNNDDDKMHGDNDDDGGVNSSSDAEADAVTILPTIIVKSEKENEIGYRVVSERSSMTTTTTEKPVLKWMPKRQQKTKPSNQTMIVTPTPFLPTSMTIETTPATQLSKLTTTQQFFRGRNRFNKRNSTSSLKVATISPSELIQQQQHTTKLNRKKLSSSSSIAHVTEEVTTELPAQQLSASSTTLFPAYVTVTPIPMTEETPVTLQSLSTSISFEVNGEKSEQTTSTPGYELVSAGVEVINTNSSNVKLFKASVVPETFDDLTFSILSHAKALEEDRDDDFDIIHRQHGDDDEHHGNVMKKKV